MDRSNGYEGVAAPFLAGRGNGSPGGVGVAAVRRWSRTLPKGAAVLDLGCGPGFPLTAVLVAEGLNVFAIDAAPSFVKRFRQNFPQVPVAHEAVQDSLFFNQSFEAVLAWGLVFLLSIQDQRRLLRSMADILVPEGRLLFTAPSIRSAWKDAMTGLESRSLGKEEYRRQLLAVGVSVTSEYEDEGENYYFDAVKAPGELVHPEERFSEIS